MLIEYYDAKDAFYLFLEIIKLFAFNKNGQIKKIKQKWQSQTRKLISNIKIRVWDCKYIDDKIKK